jgi:hypothetical protein
MLGGGSEIGGGENVLIECMHHTSFFVTRSQKSKHRTHVQQTLSDSNREKVQ